MWNDIKTFFSALYDHVAYMALWVMIFIGITYYLGFWSGVCNKVGCTFILK